MTGKVGEMSGETLIRLWVLWCNGLMSTCFVDFWVVKFVSHEGFSAVQA
jgi:hypothetical protein